MPDKKCLIHDSVQPAYTGIHSNVQCTCDNKNSTDSAGYFKWQGFEGKYSKEYRNGDLAEIDLRAFVNGPTNWDWIYTDSAGKVIRAGWTTDLLDAKSACDDFNLTFPVEEEEYEIGVCDYCSEKLPIVVCDDDTGIGFCKRCSELGQ